MKKLQILNINSEDHLCNLLGTDVRELVKICKNPKNHYRESDRNFKGKIRHIAEPKGRLKQILVRLNDLLQKLEYHESQHGGIRGRSNITNAKIHLRQPLVIGGDIQDCFPSITNRMVYRIFFKDLSCKPDIARTLTRISTINGSLPIGSPSSTALANLYLKNLSRRLDRLAKLNNARYSQFIDDITLSGPLHLSKLAKTIEKIIKQEGLKSNPSKSVSTFSDREQVVTGVRVNNQCDVPSDKLAEIKSDILSLEKKASNGDMIDINSINSLEGKIRYVGRLNNGCGKMYQRRLNRIKNRLSLHC